MQMNKTKGKLRLNTEVRIKGNVVREMYVIICCTVIKAGQQS